VPTPHRQPQQPTVGRYVDPWQWCHSESIQAASVRDRMGVDEPNEQELVVSQNRDAWNMMNSGSIDDTSDKENC
jgi:hypothetical protein